MSSNYIEVTYIGTRKERTTVTCPSGTGYSFSTKRRDFIVKPEDIDYFKQRPNKFMLGWGVGGRK